MDTKKKSQRSLLFRLLFYGMILFLVFRLFSEGGASDAVQEISYSEFVEETTRQNIASVVVIGERSVEGVFVAPIRKNDTEAREFRLLLPFDIDRETLDALAASGARVDIQSEPINFFHLIVLFGPLLFVILIIVVFVILMRRAAQGGGGVGGFSSFGKSRAKLLDSAQQRATFDDVAGCDEAKEELSEMVAFLKEPHKFTKLGGRLPKGALLVGPTGTGKTLLARAVAGEAGRPFFSTSGSEFNEMFVGVGASRVRDLFEQAKKSAPCIVFVDEIDSLGRKRHAGSVGGSGSEGEQTLNQFLKEVDGFESSEGVILLAATNRPDILDPALLRPGRFDRQITVGPPDVKGREAILKVHTREKPLADDVDLSVIARGTPAGFSGADLESLVNEAALIAAREEKDVICHKDLEKARDKVMLGPERRSLVLSEEEKSITAYHEAGHAVIALKVPGLDPLHKVTIVPHGRALGITASLPEKDRYNYTKRWLEGQLAMLYGGRVAEEMIFGPAAITTGAGNDIERATDMADRMVRQFGMSEKLGPIAFGDKEEDLFLGRQVTQYRHISEHIARLVDKEKKQILDAAYETARRVIEENRDLLEAITQALLEKETIDADDIREIQRGLNA